MAQLILTVRCTFCSQHYPPSELIRFSHEVRMCGKCREKHETALELLAVQQLPECMACKKSLEVIALEQQTNHPRLMAHWKDGIYQMLCIQCSDEYEQKRRDLYGETAYGHHKGITA